MRLLGFPVRIVDIKGQVALLVGNNDKIVLYVVNGETDVCLKHSIELPFKEIKMSHYSFFATNNPKGEILLLTKDSGISRMFTYDIGRKEWRVVEKHGMYTRQVLLENVWPVR